MTPEQAALVPSLFAIATSPSAPAARTSCPSRSETNGSCEAVTDSWLPSFCAVSVPVSTLSVGSRTSSWSAVALAWVANGAPEGGTVCQTVFLA